MEAALSWVEKRRAGYAVVSNFETIEAKHLPPGNSAQLTELITLTQSLELGKGKRVAKCCYLQRKRPLDHTRVPS